MEEKNKINNGKDYREPPTPPRKPPYEAPPKPPQKPPYKEPPKPPWKPPCEEPVMPPHRPPCEPMRPPQRQPWEQWGQMRPPGAPYPCPMMCYPIMPYQMNRRPYEGYMPPEGYYDNNMNPYRSFSPYDNDMGYMYNMPYDYYSSASPYLPEDE